MHAPRALEMRESRPWSSLFVSRPRGVIPRALEMSSQCFNSLFVSRPRGVIPRALESSFLRPSFSASLEASRSNSSSARAVFHLQISSLVVSRPRDVISRALETLCLRIFAPFFAQACTLPKHVKMLTQQK